MPGLIWFVLLELSGMGNAKHKVITMTCLQSADDNVRLNLDQMGVWNERLAVTDVYPPWFGKDDGWQWDR